MIAPKRSSVAGSTPPNKRSQTSVVVMSITPGQRAGIDELLHRLPADAGGVENEALEIVFQRIDDCVDAGRRYPEHGEADRRLAAASGGPPIALRVCGARLHHPDHGRSAIGEDLARHRIEPGDVGHGVEHHDIGWADIGGDVAGCDRRDENLGYADRQRAHRRCDQRTSARSARRNKTADRLLAADPAFERFRHRGDRSAAFAGENRIRPAAEIGRNMVRRNIGRRRAARGRQIDQNTRTPAAAIWSRMKRSSRPWCRAFQRQRPARRRRDVLGAFRLPGRVSFATASGAEVRVRAPVSIWAAGTGCDQRVGVVGFET